MKRLSSLDSFLDTPAKPSASLDDFIIGEPRPPIGPKVPNKFPSINLSSYRIAIIGEAPGKDEVSQGEPFVGESGRKLNALLSKAGIAREACFIGNVCQHQPFKNEFHFFDWNGEEIQSGIKQLQEDLTKYQPGLIICLGNASLHLLKEGNVAPRKHKNGYKWPNAITNWRGSTFITSLIGCDTITGHSTIKCLATYHPAACLRQFSWTPILGFDLLRARGEAAFPELRHPHRNLEVDLTVDEILYRLEKLRVDKPLISVDIEGYVDSMSCISIATASNYSFIVPFAKMDGSSYYETPEQECRIWRALATVLEDPLIPKVLQNSLYDRFILQYSYRIVVTNTVDDTMLKHWELFCEFEKSLAFQASIYTSEPFYKSDGKSNDRATFFRYCCNDSAVTHDCNAVMEQRLTTRTHYKFNLDLLNPILYMENRGILYDSALATERLAAVNNYIYALQASLDEIAGVGIPPQKTKVDCKALVVSKLCYKREPWRPKKDHAADYAAIQQYFLTDEALTTIQRGHISVACGVSMNIKGAGFKTYLYETLKLPKQYDDKTKALTTDEEALLKIQKAQPHEAVDIALQISSLRTRAQMLAIHSDKDGRIRCGYNIVGTETGRITCYTSPTGSGYNLQTIPAENPLQAVGHPMRNGMRDLFVADSGHYLFQCDLSGADGWTVGAHLATLGDSTMLDDLRSKLKPAAVVCYMLRHGNASLNGKSRDEIRLLLAEVKKEDWDYFACKQGIWGTCYLMGPDLLATVIAKRSEGKVWMSRSDIEQFRAAVFARYNVSIWHRWMSGHLKNQPYPPTITAASGHVRKFFGRKDEVLGQALAHEPQANTTYATNLAAYKLWSDPENRTKRSLHGEPQTVDGQRYNSCALRIEPLHQIHDAILGQFRIEDVAWATARIKSYFDNELIIAGQKITIPFEGVYGTNWALDKKSKIGMI